MCRSRVNSSLTLDYLAKTPENLYLERKRAKVSLQALANEIASFANANGGVLVVGITDDGVIEGFNSTSPNKLNECQKVVTGYLRPAPVYEFELMNVKNPKDEDDYLLLFHIRVVRKLN